MNVALAQYGEALYGPRWTSAMARDLGVASRTVRRWSAGEFHVPYYVWDELSELLAEKGEALTVMGRNDDAL